MIALLLSQLWLLGLGLWALRSGTPCKDYSPTSWLALIGAGIAPLATASLLALRPDMAEVVVEALPAALQTAAPSVGLSDAAWLAPSPDIMRLALLVYAVVALWLLVRLGARTLALHRLPAREVEPGVYLIQADLPPFALGLPRPRVVVAEQLWESLSERERAMLLAHERSHLSRRDPEVTGLLLVLQSLLWINPGMRWLVAGWRRAVEIRADRAALQDHAPRDYAALFARLARASAAPSLPVPTACAPNTHPKGEMTMRLKTILNETHTTRRTPIAALLLGSVLSLGTIAAAGPAAELAEPMPIKRVPPIMPASCPGLLDDGAPAFDFATIARKVPAGVDGTPGGYMGWSDVGEVRVKFDVDIDGVPQNISVVSANADCFRVPSVASVAKWRFPAGAPAYGVENMIRYRLAFSPGEKPMEAIRKFAG